MDDILTYVYSAISRKTILACRLYLQVTLLSDIPDIKEIFIMNIVLIGSINKYRHYTSTWSLQQKSNTNYWKLWNRTLRKIYCRTTSSPQLKQYFYFQRWYAQRNIIHRYQFSPTEH